MFTLIYHPLSYPLRSLITNLFSTGLYPLPDALLPLLLLLLTLAVQIKEAILIWWVTYIQEIF